MKTKAYLIENNIYHNERNQIKNKKETKLKKEKKHPKKIGKKNDDDVDSTYTRTYAPFLT